MKVYHSGSYGRANLMVRPCMDEPSHELWFKVETDERGELRRIARQFVVSFQEGAAEVDHDLGRYLLEKQLASPEPLPFSPAPDPGRWHEAFAPQPPRNPPMAVGTPLPTEQVLVRSPW